MSTEKVKVWDTPFLQMSQNTMMLNYVLDGAFNEDVEVRADVSRVFKSRHTPIEDRHIPRYIHFDLKDLPQKKRDNLPDFFEIGGGLTVISGKFYDLLQQFEMGKTQFFRVPLYEYGQTTLRPGDWYLINVTEKKQAIVPEESTGFERSEDNSVMVPEFDSDKPVISSAAARDGVDLWVDTRVRKRFYFSDRLKQAIKEHKIRGRSFRLRPCKMVA